MVNQPVDVAELPDLGSPLLAFLPPADVRTLARCCVVESFDAEMFDAVLRDPDGQELATLVAEGALLRRPGRRPRYRVAPMLRTALPAEVANREQRAVAVPLERYCERNGLPVDRLRALVLLGPELAAEGFEEMFDEAAAAGDLGVCLKLLHVADTAAADRHLARSRLPALIADSRRVFNMLDMAQNIGLGEGSYLPRRAIEEQLRAWLTEDPPRFFAQVRGSAGRGKSTLLRQMVSTWLRDNAGPQPPTIVWAFVDFDEIDSNLAVRHPWLVALDVVDKLDRQLPHRELGDLLDSYRGYLAALRRGLGDAPVDPGTNEADEVGERFVERLLEFLPDALGGATALVVLDTFEEVMLLPNRQAAGLIELLRRMHDAQPQIRLLISARGTDEEDALLAEHLGMDEASIEIKPFDDEQSETYLIGFRHIGRGELVDAIREKAKGSPWELALAADVVAGNPGISEEDLRALDVKFAWAVDRVIARIKEPALRWVVRYGCLTRALTLELLDQVLLPTIAEAQADPGLDDVATDSFPLPDQEPVFVATPVLPDADELWASLLRFRSHPEWSWLSAAGDHAVQFANQLRAPFDALLGRRPVARLLHTRLTDHYQRKAAAGGEEGFASLREGLYHRSRARTEFDAAGWWDAVVQAREDDRRDRSEALAEDVISYCYEELRPAPSDALLAAAHLELAWVRTRQALHGVEGAELRPQVARHLEQHEQLAELGDADDRWTRAAVLAAVDLHSGQGPAAVRRLEQLTSSHTAAVPPPDRRDALVLLADAYTSIGHLGAAARTLSNAAQLIGDTGSGTVRDSVARRRVRCAEQLGDLVAARAHVLDEVPDGRRSRTEARLALAAGLPAAAHEFVATDPTSSERVQALIELGRAAEAVSVCTEALRQTPDGSTAARMHLGRGLARAALLDVDAAVLDLQQALTRYARLGDTAMQAVCGAHLFRTYRRDIGDLLSARHQLDELTPLEGRPESERWRCLRLMTAELAYARSDEKVADDEIAELLSELDRHDPGPRPSITVAMGALCWSPRHAGTAGSRLLTNLTKVRPESARLAALADVEHVPTGRLPTAVLDLVDFRNDPAGNPLDRAWLAGRRAEILRAAGQPILAYRHACAMRDEVVAHTGYAQWRWLQSVERIGLVRAREADSRLLTGELADHDVPLFRDHREYVLLRAANLLTVLHLCRRDRGRARFTGLLDYVEDDLLTTPFEERLTVPARRPTRWHRLVHDLRKSYPSTGDSRADRRMRERDAADAERQLAVELGDPSADRAGLGRPSPDDDIALHVDLDGPLVVRTSSAVESLRLPAHDELVAALRQGTAGRAAVVRVLKAGNSLRFRELLPPPDRPHSDVCITAPPLAVPVPWELGMLGSRPLAGQSGVGVVYRHLPRADRYWVRVLQEMLVTAGMVVPVDGQFGQRTRKAIRELKKRSGVPADNELDARTWSRLRRRVRDRPTEIVVDGDADLDDVPLADGLDVLRLTGRMQDVGGSPYVARPGRRPIKVPDVDRLVVRMIEAGGRVPLIVVEPQKRPQFSSETLFELLLRNAFADALLRLGNVPCVLATGLAADATADLVGAAYTRGLEEDETAAELARRLQHGAPKSAWSLDTPPWQNTLPWTATALFTVLRPSEMPPLGYLPDAARRPTG